MFIPREVGLMICSSYLGRWTILNVFPFFLLYPSFYCSPWHNLVSSNAMATLSQLLWCVPSQLLARPQLPCWQGSVGSRKGLKLRSAYTALKHLCVNNVWVTNPKLIAKCVVVKKINSIPTIKSRLKFYQEFWAVVLHFSSSWNTS